MTTSTCSRSRSIKTFAEKALDMFMKAPQVSVRGARIPSDMSARAPTSKSWAHLSEFPVIRRSSAHKHPMVTSAFPPACGMIYIVLSLALSAYYAVLVTQHLANDLWWPNFNATGAHSYLVDMINMELLHAIRVGGVDFAAFDPALALPRDYSRVDTANPISTTYNRALLYSQRFDFDNIIPTLRVPFVGIVVRFTQYCWVDFNQTWETAHTDARQARCNQRYASNGAVYWETSLRNVKWAAFQRAFGGAEGAFTITIANAILKHPLGSSYLKYLSQCNGNVPVADEAAYWRAHNISFFQLGFENYFSVGIVDTVNVVNALGLQQSLTIKQVDAKTRGSGWTTMLMSWGVGNDLAILSSNGHSMIRGDPANLQFSPACTSQAMVDNGECAHTIDEMYGYDDSYPVVNVTHACIGPYGSVDLMLMALPIEVSAAVTSWEALVTAEILRGGAFYSAMQDQALNDPAWLDPVPREWTNPNWLYMGGDPTCPTRSPVPFVQSSWAFDVSCDLQSPLELPVSKLQLLFAVASFSLSHEMDEMTAGQAATLCGLCTSARSGTCEKLVLAAVKAFHQLCRIDQPTSCHDLVPAMSSAQSAVSSSKVGLVQFALDTGNDGSPFLLQQVLLSGTTSDENLWDFFGWLYVYEWAYATREVVSFQGDAGVHTLMSDAYEPLTSQVKALEVPVSACQYLRVITIYVTFGLSVVGTLVLGFAAAQHLHVKGANLLCFNRVAGSVWIGRPFQLVRGMTALIVLATSPLAFDQSHGYAKFWFRPRMWFDVCVLAGEATWITYVLQDMLLLFLGNVFRQSYVPVVGTAVVWLAHVFVEVASPFQASMRLDRRCTSIDLEVNIRCSSGVVHVGSLDRVNVLLAIQVSVVLGTFALFKAWHWLRQTPHRHRKDGHLLISGVALTFLHFGDVNADGDDEALLLDRATCAMCGLLCYRDYVFDIKLWILVHDSHANARSAVDNMKQFPSPNLALPYMDMSTTVDVVAVQSARHHRRYMAIGLAVAGCVYMALSVAGSVSFLLVSHVSMANDFWWGSFNATGAHAFISTWYNGLMATAISNAPLGQVHLNDIQFIDPSRSYAANATTTAVPALYAAMVVHESAADLQKIVTGLRQMDGCSLPWIATQYCWVDFGKSWEMGNSLARQRRCESQYSDNGAVYLESVLRNAQWKEFTSCWGQSLEIALARDLRQTIQGASWWSSVQKVDTTVQDEVLYWQTQGGIQYFDTAWQNYKTIGIVESYGIQNAFGLVYSMTLKSTNGSFRLALETSRKAYWGLAADLWAVTSSTLPIMSNRSLIRHSANFAFRNTSVASVMAHNRSLPWPLSGQFATFDAVVGPFGSVDLKFLPRPTSLVRFVQQAKDVVYTAIRLDNDTNARYMGLAIPGQFGAVVPSWDGLSCAGGNVLCPEAAADTACSSGLGQFVGVNTVCGLLQGEVLTPTPLQSVLAVIATGLARSTITTTDLTKPCAYIAPSSLCKRLVYAPIMFALNSSGVASALPTLLALAQVANADVRAANVSIVQWTRPLQSRGPRTLSSISFFAANTTVFHWHMWHFILEWATLSREVVSFQGDVGTVTVLTTYVAAVSGAFNPLEVPVNVAYYMRITCMYTTGVIGIVGAFAIVYALVSKFHVEGYNMFKINRVAGVVWVGRPLLFLRSMTAICLLSTQSLELVKDRNLTYFANVQRADVTRIFVTLLSAGEVSWLVFVLNDIGTVITKQYTQSYSSKCGVLVWLVSAALSFGQPVVNTADVGRTCDVDAVDWQLVCSTGVVHIGSPCRFWVLIGVCVGATVVCFVIDYIRFPHLEGLPRSSLFLSSSAKFLFSMDGWTEFEVYHLDMSSAAMNGMLAVPCPHGFYIFDVKTWKLMYIPAQHGIRTELLHRKGRSYLRNAIPLAE
ncbi:hypothetical protein DYB36_003715 [Aphanomyces astaci]|uniref:Uncharacterized protein n=1 Tax=Aphanomyces astaci TaxID=112090 RepID=A0A397A7D9_APHAT|nr:hypothetical protein DYB36_003715 [Aphanomyces astaci]